MPHPVDEHVGRRLRQLRKSGGLSQGELGERLGITFQQVQKYERGTNRVSASRLHEAAEVLGVTIVDFFDGLPGSGTHSGFPASYAEVATDKDLRRLISLYERTPPAVRQELMALVEVLGRTDRPLR